MKKISKLTYILGIIVISFILFILPFRVKAASTANTIFSGNRFVTMSPNGTAFTIGYGDKGVEKHDYSYLGYESQRLGNIGPQVLGKGQHYYKGLFVGAVPVANWKVSHVASACIHSNPSMDITYCGVNQMGANISNCHRFYNAGWIPYCAICGEEIVHVYFYMSEDMADTLSYIPSGLYYSAYFYLCPYDNSLENSSRINHVCTKVSNNRYKVFYYKGSQDCGGIMSPEWFYYDNATEYEGQSITAQSSLSLCGFYQDGYLFEGWALYPDGEVVFPDGASWMQVQEYFELGDKLNESEVSLYAVWRPVSSKLHVSYGGGNVAGNYSDVDYEKSYGACLNLDVPVFPDFEVELDASLGIIDGATKKILLAKRTFTEWRKSSSFHGKLVGNDYYFLSTLTGSIDYLTACSSTEPIVLPSPRRSGYCFEGWFDEDDGFAGFGGDEYTPESSIKLVAKWSEIVLALTTEPNYSANANNGKGAADLYWESTDNRADAAYRVSQSQDCNRWNVIGENGSVYSSVTSAHSFLYKGGAEERFLVDSTGVYQIELWGAEGGRTGNYAGGKGGKVNLRMWLQAGEILSVITGGRGADYSSSGLSGTYAGGAGGGGNGYGQASGGGATWLYITSISGTKKLVAVAGGGGGGSLAGNGGAGGSSSNVLQYGVSPSGRLAGTSTAGTTIYSYYSSGGGGGYNPGKGGQITYRKHVHSMASSECRYHAHTGNSISGGGCYSIANTTGAKVEYPIVCYSTADESYVCHMHNLGYPVYGTIINCQTFGFFDGYWHYTGRTGYLSCPLCGTNPNLYSNGQIGGTYDVNTTVTTYSRGCNLEEGYNCISGIPTVNTYYQAQSYASGGGANTVFVNNGVEYRILSSSYNRSSDFGVNSGNGRATVTTLVSNCLSVKELIGVTATDREPPSDLLEYTLTSLGGNLVKINWNEPDDRGTKYYFKVDDYSASSGEIMATSNISSQTLTTGIKGYYLLENRNSQTVVNASNGNFCIDSSVTVILNSGEEKYVHIAAVDRAGNIGNTIHIRLSGDADPELPMLWDLSTEKLTLQEGDNIYEKELGTYYVKADGETPFYIEYKANMEGSPRDSYKIDECIFEERDSGANMSVLIDSFDSPNILAGGVRYEEQGGLSISRYAYTMGSVLENGKAILLTQGFLAPTTKNGESVVIIPRAAATERNVADGRVVSDRNRDLQNGIELVMDAKSPDIYGLDSIKAENFFIDYGDVFSVREIDISVSDAESGLNADDFYVTFENNDNGCLYTWKGDSTGQLNMVIDESVMEDIFRYGSFTITVHAADNVGNVTEEIIDGFGFNLDTAITRLLEPIDGKTIFARGESGELTIVTRGYADYVEVLFPEELSSYNMIYDYTNNPEYEKEETIQFMIPLYDLPEGDIDFTVTVIARRDGQELESHPRINVVEVSGSVLEELFTSLR